MEQPRIDQFDIVRVEMRRRAAEMRKIEPVGEFIEGGDRLDRLRRADPCEQRQQGHRLDALFAQMLGAEGAQAFRQFALRRNQQRFMGELRRPRAERLEHLDLRRAVGHMILTADDARDPEVDVVDHARQQIQPAAILAADDGSLSSFGSNR